VLHKRVSLLLWGAPEMHKSQQCHMMSRTFCRRKGAQFYALAKSIDPFGVLSKWHIAQQAGCICVTDFDWSTMRGDPLTIEETKSLVDVQEGGQVRARFHNAMFAAKQPRIFAVNGDAESLEAELLERGLSGLALMIQGRWDELRTQNAHQQAICRILATSS
jgi:hypothetical protein